MTATKQIQLTALIASTDLDERPSLTISYDIEENSRMLSSCIWYGEVDQTIGRHGEPHVVRVSVVCPLRIGVNKQIFFVSACFYLSEDLQVLKRSIVAVSSINTSMNKHLPSSWRNHIGNGVRKGSRVLKIWWSNWCHWHRSPLVQTIVGWLWTNLHIRCSGVTRFFNSNHRLVCHGGTSCRKVIVISIWS